MDDSVKRYRQRRDERIKKRMDADFREGDHPRDESGRFTSGGGKASGGTRKPKKEIEHNVIPWHEGNEPMSSFERARTKKKGPPKYTNEPPSFWEYAKIKPGTSDGDFQKEGYRKNREGRWAK